MSNLRLIKLIQFIATFFFLIISSALYAQSNNPAGQLSSLLNNFHSMSAQFNQNIIDPNGNIIQQSSGNMALQRPGKFRWQTQRPNPQLALADGKNIWVYDPQLQQATRQKQTAINNSPGALLSGNVSKLAQQFNVKSLAPIANTDQGFILTPNDKNALFQSVQLYFNHGLLQTMRLKDNLDQLTLIQFHQVKNNIAINPSLFRFSPPKGVDVVTGN